MEQRLQSALMGVALPWYGSCEAVGGEQWGCGKSSKSSGSSRCMSYSHRGSSKLLMMQGIVELIAKP